MARRLWPADGRFPSQNCRIAGLQTDLAKDFRPGNAPKSENFFAVSIEENQVTGMEKELPGKNGHSH